jgi:hypothetical protein
MNLTLQANDHPIRTRVRQDERALCLGHSIYVVGVSYLHYVL